MLRLLFCALIVSFSSVQLAIGQVVAESTQIPDPLPDCTVLYCKSRQ